MGISTLQGWLDGCIRRQRQNIEILVNELIKFRLFPILYKIEGSISECQNENCLGMCNLQKKMQLCTLENGW